MYTSITLRASEYGIRHATCTVTCSTNLKAPMATNGHCTLSIPLKVVVISYIYGTLHTQHFGDYQG